MGQTITTSVNDLAQAFSIAFRQEFQPLKQELQILAANSTSQHLDNGTGTSRIACEGDSMANIKRKYTINGERTDARKEGVPNTQRVYRKRLPPFFYGELETDNKEKLRVCSEGVCHAVSG